VKREKTNLLLLLTPHIIREPGQMVTTSQEQKKKMTENFNEQKKEVEGTFPDPKPREKR
jgi:type II secretory pathway component GspD/PulD (secretin)